MERAKLSPACCYQLEISSGLETGLVSTSQCWDPSGPALHAATVSVGSDVWVLLCLEGLVDLQPIALH